MQLFIVGSVTEEKLRILSVYFVNGVNSSHKTRRTSFGAKSVVAQLITKLSAFCVSQRTITLIGRLPLNLILSQLNTFCEITSIFF